MRRLRPVAPVVVESHPGPAPMGSPNLLFLHGLAGNETGWDGCADLLSAQQNVWNAKLPWRGQGLPGWGRVHDLGPWVDEAISAVPGGVDVLVAHSMSSNVVLELLDNAVRSGSNPLERYGIRALVLVSPFYRGAPEQFDWATISYYLNGFHLIIEEGIRAHSGGRLARETEEAIALRVREWIGPYGWLRFFDLFLRTPALSTHLLDLPCVVIGGANDIAAPPVNAISLADALPEARLHIMERSGHFPMVDEAERFAAHVQDFIDAALAPRWVAALQTSEPIEG